MTSLLRVAVRGDVTFGNENIYKVAVALSAGRLAKERENDIMYYRSKHSSKSLLQKHVLPMAASTTIYLALYVLT